MRSPTDASVKNLTHKLIEEFIIVAILCALLLWHIRSALVAVVTLQLADTPFQKNEQRSLHQDQRRNPISRIKCAIPCVWEPG